MRPLKYVILSGTYRRGMTFVWAMEMHPDEYKIITDPDRLRGYDFTHTHVILLRGSFPHPLAEARMRNVVIPAMRGNKDGIRETWT